MMKIKNACARLITINDDGNAYRFMPAGESVDIPESVAGSMYVKALIENGSLAIVSDEADTGDVGDTGGTGSEDIIAELESLGVTVDKRWGEDRLAQELEKALGE